MKNIHKSDSQSTEEAKVVLVRRRFDVVMNQDAWQSLNRVKEELHIPTDAEALRKAVRLLLKVVPVLRDPDERLVILDKNGKEKVELDFIV